MPHFLHSTTQHLFLQSLSPTSQLPSAAAPSSPAKDQRRSTSRTEQSKTLACKPWLLLPLLHLTGVPCVPQHVRPFFSRALSALGHLCRGLQAPKDLAKRGPLVRVRLKAGGPFTYEGFVLILPQERTKQIGRSMAAPGLKRSRYVAPTTLKVKSMAAASWTAPLSRRLPPNIICCQTIKEQRLRTSSLPILGLRLSSWGQCAAATSRSG